MTINNPSPRPQRLFDPRDPGSTSGKNVASPLAEPSTATCANGLPAQGGDAAWKAHDQDAANHW